MKLEHILLGLLAWRPRDGYEIVKWLEGEGQFLRSNTHHSQVYRELGRLVRNGWAEFETDPRDGRPDAKVYRLTEVGHAALLDWAQLPYEPPSRFQDADFTARFLFLVGIDLEATVEMVRTELTFRRAQVAANRTRDRRVNFSGAIPELDQVRTTSMLEELHRFGARSIDAWIEWLESLEARLVGRHVEAVEVRA